MCCDLLREGRGSIFEAGPSATESVPIARAMQSLHAANGSQLPHRSCRRALRCCTVAAKGGGGKAKGPKKSLLSTPSGEPLCPNGPAPHMAPAVIFHALTLIDSYKRATQRALLAPGGSDGTIGAAPGALFNAPAVVVSHNTEADPVFNYGNAAALALWGLDWAAFTALPSRKSAADDPEVQANRGAALAEALARGFCDGYAGVRVTSSGRRFRIEDATLWQVRLPSGDGLESEDQGKCLGQAATFTHITWVDPPVKESEFGQPGERWRFTGGPDGAMELVSAGDESQQAAPQEPPPAVTVDVAALTARVDAQAAVVRGMKAEGRAKDDPDLATAVAQLLQLKAELAQAPAQP